MMKAILLFSTMMLSLASTALPKLNKLPLLAGKSIKACQFATPKFFHTDSSDLVVLPEFHFLKGPGNYQLRTVVIDPGHGGHDPGCLGAHSREKHVALAIGKNLADLLRANYPGLNVIMTRSTDVFVPLHERAAIATRNKADLFISIHCNAFPRAEAHGTETYVLGLHATEANLEVAKRENEAILLEDNYKENYGYDPNSPEAHILFSMFQNAFLEQSISFAEKVQGHAAQHTGRTNRGVKQAGFLVLRHATMPSVLVETGYLTNYNDEKYLATSEGQMEMAIALLLAFGEYKNEMEGTKTPPLNVAGVKPKEWPSQTGTAATPSPAEGQALPVKQETATIQEERPKPSRKIELAIEPPPPAPTPEAKTNTSPTKPSKIVATPPVSAGPTIPQNTAKAEPAVQYCVQLAASPNLLDLNAGKWSRTDQTVEVITEAGLYKYQVRNFTDFDSANQVRQHMRSIGFSDAFIVAYRDGKRVDPKTLK